ncbi:hypothetical protein FJR01_18655 [Dolichospermum sp. UHCC 0299]|nr:hypothetical protein [Dolichospermum sp. UHCC 0299]
MCILLKIRRETLKNIKPKIISWSALHRRHHELSDKHGDPHSPNLHGGNWRDRIRGLIHSHLTWMYKHEYPSVVHYVPDLIKNKNIVRVDRYYYLWASLGFVLPTLLGGLYHWSLAGALAGFIWGGVFRIIWGGHTIWSINSFLHCFGMSRFETEEHSHNFGPIALLTFGESWHNNHHAFPGSASFGLEWYRLARISHKEKKKRGQKLRKCICKKHFSNYKI